jgi:hypothetical protein
MTRIKQKQNGQTTPRSVRGKVLKRRSRAAAEADAASNISTDRRKRRGNPARTTKKAAIGSLLRRSDGATIDDMMKATGWLAHSIRAMLTGLRKAGDEIVRSEGSRGTSRYRIAAER